MQDHSVIRVVKPVWGNIEGVGDETMEGWALICCCSIVYR